MKRLLSNIQSKTLLVVGVVALIWIVVSSAGWLKSLEQATVDWRFKYRGEIPDKSKVVYLEIEDDTLAHIGEWPFPRSVYADAIEILNTHGKPKVIGIKTLFDGFRSSSLIDKAKVEADAKYFKDVLEKYNNVVISAYLPEETLSSKKGEAIDGKIKLPEKNILPVESPTIIGFTNFDYQYSPGAQPRWIPLFATTPYATHYAFPLQMYRVYAGLEKAPVLITENRLVLGESEGSNNFKEIPLADGHLMEINYFSPWNSQGNVRIPLMDLFKARDGLSSGDSKEKELAAGFFKQFEEAAVFIAITAPKYKEHSVTPMDGRSVPLISAQGNLFKTLVNEAYLKRTTVVHNVLIVLGLTVVCGLLILKGGRWDLLWNLVGFLAIGGYVWVAFEVFGRLNLILPVVLPVYAAGSVAIILLLYRAIKSEKQRTHMQRLFGSYVSPHVVDEMVKNQYNPQLGGEEKLITALFSDIENFTMLSERLSPRQLTQLMNEYLNVMTHTIQAEEGALDKYIGDSIVAMFGAPLPVTRHPEFACRAALNMIEAEKHLKQRWQVELAQWPDLVRNFRTRVGVNTGLAVVGNIGSETRFQYTMLGDDVNLASRCQSELKRYGIQVMTTETTYAQCVAITDEIQFRKLDKLVIKGKTSPVRMYEVVGYKQELSSAHLECISLFEKALSIYEEGDLMKAKGYFDRSAILEGLVYKNVSPSTYFREKCLMGRKGDLRN